MNADHHRIAEACHHGALDGSVPFPAGVATLMGAGFDGYAIDFRAGTATYYRDNDSHTLPSPAVRGKVAPGFDAGALGAAIAAAQANGPGYTYAGFCDTARAAGCAGYVVSFSGRRVLYYAATAETHVEHFPR